MNNESLVHNLYKFIKEGATLEKLQESNKRAYPGTKTKLNEGKLPDDPSLVKDPKKDIQLLSEKDDEQKTKQGDKDAAENPKIKTDNAGVTEEPEETEVTKELDKETPDINKLTQNKKGEDPLVGKDKVKDEKKVTPEVSGVTKEGKLPSDHGKDNSIIVDPEEQIHMLSEEKVLTTVSDEKVAKDISSKYPGSHVEVVRAADGKEQFVVMVREKKIRESVSPEDVAKVLAIIEQEIKDNMVTKEDMGTEYLGELIRNYLESDMDELTDKITEELAKKGIKVQESKKVKEDIEVSIKTEDEEISVVSTDDGIQATKVDVVSEEQPVVVVEEEPATEEKPANEEELDFVKDEKEWDDKKVEEMGEKIAVADYLGTLSKLTEKQEKFMTEVKNTKIGKINKAKLVKK